MKEPDPVADNQWTTIIQSDRSWFDFNLKEIWAYRDLVLLFVRRDFVSIYKQTILGPIWFFIQPLLTTIVFTIVFGKIARIPTDGLPPALFYMAGIVSWNYFSACLSTTSKTFIDNANIFGKVYFPRLAVPIAVVLINILTFLIQFLLFLCFLAYFYFKGVPIKPSPFLILSPFLIIQMGLLGLGTGIIVSSLTTKYRDLTFLVGFGTQLWMYSTPVVYPMSQIPERWQWILALNPMAITVESFRYLYLGTGTINYSYMLVSVFLTVIILFIGLFLFNRVEKTFMDTV